MSASVSYPELSGRRAIVTGAATGIGRAIARALARQNVRVAVCDINPSEAEKAAAEFGGEALAATTSSP